MLIKDNRYNSRVQFKDILCGEVFADEDENVLLRIDSVYNEFGSWNAVFMGGGVPTCFNDDDEVVKLNAELIISN